MANEFARNGSQSAVLPIEMTDKPPISYCQSFQKGSQRRRRLHLETCCKLSRAYKEPAPWRPVAKYLGQSRLKGTCSILSFSRSDPRVVVGILTGQCSVKYLISICDNGGPGYCWLCEDEELVPTITHLLRKCPTLSSKRFWHVW